MISQGPIKALHSSRQPPTPMRRRALADLVGAWRLEALLPIALVGALLVGSSAAAYAADGGEEMRLKLDVDAAWGPGPTERIRPFVMLEQRFREGDVSLLKSFAGVRWSALSWLKVQSYYAYVDNIKKDTTKHLAVVDLKLRAKLGPFTFVNRHGNEWHSDPGFYRYRDSVVAILSPGIRWLRLWLGEEIRVDSDEGRITMNDITAGMDFKLSSSLTLRAYYDRESKRRGGEVWKNSDVFQIKLTAHLGG